jgi:hypothetical protein
MSVDFCRWVMDTVCGPFYPVRGARGLTTACSGRRSAPPLMLSVKEALNKARPALLADLNLTRETTSHDFSA